MGRRGHFELIVSAIIVALLTLPATGQVKIDMPPVPKKITVQPASRPVHVPDGQIDPGRLALNRYALARTRPRVRWYPAPLVVGYASVATHGPGFGGWGYHRPWGWSGWGWGWGGFHGGWGGWSWAWGGCGFRPGFGVWGVGWVR